MLFAAPMALLLTMGVFSCHVDEMQQDVMTPGTTCYRVLSIAGQADWMYALVTVNWSVLMGFEVFNDTYLAGVAARSRIEDTVAPMIAASYEHEDDMEDRVEQTAEDSQEIIEIRTGGEVEDASEVETRADDVERDGAR